MIQHLAGSVRRSQISGEKAKNDEDPERAAGLNQKLDIRSGDSGAEHVVPWPGSLAVSVIDISFDGKTRKLQYQSQSSRDSVAGGELEHAEQGHLKIDDLQAVPALEKDHVRIVCSTKCTDNPRFKQLYKYFIPNPKHILDATKKSFDSHDFDNSILPAPGVLRRMLLDQCEPQKGFLLPAFSDHNTSGLEVPELLSVVVLHSQDSAVVFCEAISPLPPNGNRGLDGSRLISQLRKRLLSSDTFTNTSNGSMSHMLPLIILDVFENLVDCGLLFLKNFTPDSDDTKEHPEWRAHVCRSLKYHRLLEWASDLSALIAIIQHLAQSCSVEPSLTLVQKPIDFQNQSRHLELEKVIKRRIERENRKFLLFKDTLNIEETQGVARLTLLATIFLPLSLAASLLSMQTRLANLKWIIYDFCGCFFVIGTLAFLAYPMITMAFDYLARQERDPSKLLQGFEFGEGKAVNSTKSRSTYKSPGIICVICVGLIIPSSFLVGMVKDTTLGLKILGYGAAATIGLLLSVAIPTAITFVIIIRSWMKSLLGINNRYKLSQRHEDISAIIAKRQKDVQNALLQALSE